MSSDFDPSPRASKRRRITRYGGQRTMLAEEGKENAATQQDGPYGANGTKEVVGHKDLDAIALDTERSPPLFRTSSAKQSNKLRADGRSEVDAEHQEDTRKAAVDSEKPPRIARRANLLSSRKTCATTRSRDLGVNGGSDFDEDQDGDDESKEPSNDEVPQPRSSGRQRKPPQRLADCVMQVPSIKRLETTTAHQDLDESASDIAVLKGILTPSKKQRVGPRKSVIFQQDEKEIEEQLGFRDIGTPAKASTRKATPHPRRSKQVEDTRQKPTATRQEQELDTGIEDDVFDSTLSDEPILTVPLPDLTIISEQLTALSNLSDDDPNTRTIRSTVLRRLTSNVLPRKTPSNLESQYSQLHSLLRSTITTCESNSLLLLGPRGAGKSLLLSLALRDLENAYPDNFHKVHLNGFLQTDDRLALREIWRQLGQSRNLDESETEDIGASYADTMASLLSLLSHPDEVAISAQSGAKDMGIAQEATTTAGSPRKTSKSVVFVLDEFDLFTTHPRQTLLYNLFDIAQSKKAPIAVVGCSTRMDVIECLEKRVKSRFSHRWLLVPGVKTMGEWNQCVDNALLVDTSEEEGAKRTDEKKCAQRWNEHVRTVFVPSKEVQTLIKAHFHTTKSLPDLFMALFPLVTTLQPPASSATLPPFRAPNNITLPVIHGPTILTTLFNLPILHLSLLISLTRLETIHHLEAANFNLVHAHYTELVAQSRLRQSSQGAIATSGSLRQWSRELCRGAWEELGDWRIIVPVAGGREGGPDESADEETNMWRAEVGLEDVEWGIREKFKVDGGGAVEVLLKWCREI